MVLNEAYHVVLLRRFDEFVVMLQQLYRRLSDQDVKTTLDCVERDAIMSAYNAVRSAFIYAPSLLTVWREDDDGISR